MNANYGAMFAEVLRTNILELTSSDWKRDRNPGAPFKFGENHLRKFIKSAIEKGSYTPPPDWPRLIIERKVSGDLELPGRRHGGVDYLFVSKNGGESLRLTDLLATCEVAGPARPILLGGSKDNWYPKIVGDINKQLWRAKTAPNCEHYLALLLQPRRKFDLLSDLNNLLVSMQPEIHEASLTETSLLYLNIRDQPLTIATYRVNTT